MAEKELNYTPFHLAFPVSDLPKTREFFEGILGCTVGRTDTNWIDFNFFGHQITAHKNLEEAAHAISIGRGSVDSKQVPCRHFGAILKWDQFDELASKLQSSKVKFIIEPYLRFKGQVGEQKTMFVLDPSGNALEFKSFRHHTSIFRAKL